MDVLVRKDNVLICNQKHLSCLIFCNCLIMSLKLYENEKKEIIHISSLIAKKAFKYFKWHVFK